MNVAELQGATSQLAQMYDTFSDQAFALSNMNAMRFNGTSANELPEYLSEFEKLDAEGNNFSQIQQIGENSAKQLFFTTQQAATKVRKRAREPNSAMNGKKRAVDSSKATADALENGHDRMLQAKSTKVEDDPPEEGPRDTEEQQAKVENEKGAKKVADASGQAEGSEAPCAETFKNRKGNWRKYGQKSLGNNTVRSYYRCNFPGCPVKRQIVKQNGREFTGEQTEFPIRTIGTHNHPPLNPVQQEVIEIHRLDGTVSWSSTNGDESRAVINGALNQLKNLQTNSLDVTAPMLAGCSMPMPPVPPMPATGMTAMPTTVEMQQAMGQIPVLDTMLTTRLSATVPSFVITDPSQPGNPITCASVGFSQLTGYNQSEVVGQNCRFLQGVGTDREKTRLIAEAVSKHLPVQTVILNYKKNGDAFWNLIQITPIKGLDGQVLAMLGQQTDVSLMDPKRAQAQSIAGSPQFP